jgi:thiol peroxidase
MSIKDRKVGGEAPAVRVKMSSGEEKIVGMMAVKFQLFYTLSDFSLFDDKIVELTQKYEKKLFTYLISSDDVSAGCGLSDDMVSVDYEKFAKSFGLNHEEGSITNSLFLVDKEGVIKFRQIGDELDIDSAIALMEEELTRKIKGHSHENWLGA